MYKVTRTTTLKDVGCAWCHQQYDVTGSFSVSCLFAGSKHHPTCTKPMVYYQLHVTPWFTLVVCVGFMVVLGSILSFYHIGLYPSAYYLHVLLDQRFGHFQKAS